MIEENIPPIPIEIFKWGLRRGNGRLRSITPDLIKSVYPIRQASVTAKGILMNGLYYTSKTALKEGWFSTARQHGNWKIDAHYDPQNMSQIYLRKDRKEYEVCTLVDQYKMYQSARIEEVMDLNKTKRQQVADYQESEINGQIKLAQEIEEIVNKAKEEEKIYLSEGTKNIKDIRQNRKEEQELTRQKRSVDNQVSRRDVPPTVNSASKKIRNIDLFRQKQKEGLNNENH